MCLILLAHGVNRDYPLVLAANRDEFYDRPTAVARFWEDAPHVLAGRDERAAGTWMGITRTGRWAALTNYRDPPTARLGRPSRGTLVADYLRGNESPASYLGAIADRSGEYDGFNLIVGAAGEVYYLGNRTAEGAVPRELGPGVYGLSNHLLDTPWPKVSRGKRGLQELLDGGTPTADGLLDILYDTEIAPPHALPDTGLGAEWERALSASFIVTPTYGTRASTALLLDSAGGATYVERSFLPGESPQEEVRFEFRLEAQ